MLNFNLAKTFLNIIEKDRNMVYREVLEGNFKNGGTQTARPYLKKIPDSKKFFQIIWNFEVFEKVWIWSSNTPATSLIVIDLVKIFEILIIENDFFHHKIRFNRVQSQNYKL